jgi:hypothetical protein
LSLAFANQDSVDSVKTSSNYGAIIPKGFELSVNGGVTAFGYDFARVGASVDINGSDVSISVYVSVNFGLFSIGGTVTIHLGSISPIPKTPPPALGTVSNGVLTLNIGPNVGARGTPALSNEAIRFIMSARTAMARKTSG